jgi:predicted nucleic-acid-binding Zn-ribbon protein
MSNKVECPKCGSDQITTNKKGFSGSKAAAGAILIGGMGLLAGTAGSNKIIITCLSCGYQFKPGQQSKAPTQIAGKSIRSIGVFGLIFGVIFLILGGLLIFCEAWGTGSLFILMGILGVGMYRSNRKIMKGKIS